MVPDARGAGRVDVRVPGDERDLVPRDGIQQRGHGVHDHRRPIRHREDDDGAQALRVAVGRGAEDGAEQRQERPARRARPAPAGPAVDDDDDARIVGRGAGGVHVRAEQRHIGRVVEGAVVARALDEQHAVAGRLRAEAREALADRAAERRRGLGQRGRGAVGLAPGEILRVEGQRVLLAVGPRVGEAAQLRRGRIRVGLR